MAFWNKEKKEEIKRINREHSFKIIQFAKMKGLRKKDEVEYTIPISPIFGSKNIKNVEIVKNTVIDDKDTDFKYDSFRQEEDKKLTKDQIIQRKGSELYDFETVDKKIQETIKKEEKEIKPFDMFGENLEKDSFIYKEKASKEDEIFSSYSTEDDEFEKELENFNDVNDEKISLFEQLNKEEEKRENNIKPIDFGNNEQDIDEDIDEDILNDNTSLENIDEYEADYDSILNDTEEYDDIYKNNDLEEIKDEDNILKDLLDDQDTKINSFDSPLFNPNMKEKEEKIQDEYDPLVFSTHGYENSFENKPKSKYFLGSFENNTNNNINNNNNINEDEYKPIQNEITNNNNIFSVDKNYINKEQQYEKVIINKTSNKEQPYKLENEYNDEEDFVIQKYYVSTDGLKKSSITLNDKPEWLLKQVERINQTLVNFKIEGEVVNTRKGPTVTRYEIRVDNGVKVNKVASLQDNFQLQLAVTSIRIEAPIPGKRLIGIEAPNEKKEIVKYANVIDYEGFYDSKKNLEVPLGLDIDGNIIKANIKNMPHGLIAGATNSGKSVCVNTILISLLLKNSPDDLRLILVDPKKVELMPYNDIPHLITPVIDDPKIASQALKWVVDEMEKRYEIFAENRVRNMEAYNEKVLNKEIDAKKMYYLIVIIDELADLMQVASQDVEVSIQRITQKARAAGIHLLIATQRPTTDVVKGTIKANIPSRIAFKVASYTDSSTILDQAGAEKLLGKGDMLYKELDQPKRLQGALIVDDEIYSIIDSLKERYKPNYLFLNETLNQIQRSKEMVNDEYFKDVARFVVDEDKASINQITKTFKIGFNRAQEIVRNLERFGILEPQEGNKPSKVVVTQTELEELLKDI